MVGRTRRTHGAGSSSSDPGPEIPVTDPTLALAGVLQGMIQAQQEQNAILRTGMETAQRTAEAALDRAAAPPELRPGGVSNFCQLQPASFAGTESPLEADQWLVDMNNLLTAARVPAGEQVEVVKIQLTDLARTWWLAEEKTHTAGAQVT